MTAILNRFFNQRIILEALLAAKVFSTIPCSFISIKQTSWQASRVSLVVKKPPANAGDAGDAGLIPESERSPGGRNSDPLQYSWLGNPPDRGTWWTTAHRVTERRTRLSNLTRVHWPLDCHFNAVFLWYAFLPASGLSCGTCAGIVAMTASCSLVEAPGLSSPGVWASLPLSRQDLRSQPKDWTPQPWHCKAGS